MGILPMFRHGLEARATQSRQDARAPRKSLAFSNSKNGFQVEPSDRVAVEKMSYLSRRLEKFAYSIPNWGWLKISDEVILDVCLSFKKFVAELGYVVTRGLDEIRSGAKAPVRSVDFVWDDVPDFDA